jgi:hypothetical protein
MRDELKRCANCGHEHRVGIVNYSQDGVPLYGPRACYCHCDRFTEKQDGDDAALLPSLTNEQTKQLWEQTSFMNAQAPAATRIAVAKLMALGEGKGQPGSIGRLFGRGDGKTALERQWPEFVGFLISQITDMRGAMVRDESKFAHLVSHTDEIVEAMRGVAQLKERLDNIYATQERILETLDRLGEKQIQEAAHVFDSNSAPLRDEPIAIEPEDD